MNHTVAAYGLMTSQPTHFLRTSGTTTLPSACWNCSRMAGMTRDVARPEPFREWMNSFLPVSLRLKRIFAGVGAGGNLLVDAHAGDPDLDVVGLHHGSAAVLCGQLGEPVVESQTLQQSLSLADQLLKSGLGGLGGGVLEHLDLVELVTADHAALVGTVAAGLFAEAGSVCEQLLRQL